MDPSCLASMVQAAGGLNGVRIFFLAHFGPLSTEHNLNATASIELNIIAVHVHPFMTTVYTSSDG